MARLLLLTDSDIRRLVPVWEAVEVVEQAFARLETGTVQMPPKLYLDFPRYRGDIRVMPGALGELYAGVKLVNSHPANPGRGLPAVVGTYVLFSQETGMPLCLMGATFLTAVRTGAASGVACRYMARRDSSTLGLIGAGVQAAYQVDAVTSVLEIREIRAWAPATDEARRDAFLETVAARHPGIRFQRADSIAEAADAAVVCTTTPSRQPLLRAGQVRAGTHINAVGADGPGKQELDPGILAGARVIVDEMHQALHGGEVNVAISEGLLTRDRIAGTLSQVVSGRLPGRLSDEEITIFDSTGLAVQDIAVAVLAYERALESGAGSWIDL